MTTATVSVWCLGGLGNRMRALLSSLGLAEEQGRDFAFVWDHRSSDFRPNLEDLWVTDLKEWSQPRALATALRHGWFLESDMREWPSDAMNRKVISLRTGSYIINAEGDRYAWGKHFRELTPVAAIEERISAPWKSLVGRQFVGVMVRAHSEAHQKTKDASPVSWYVRRMNELQREYPGLAFYVSSDTQSAVDEIRSEVRDVISQSDKGPYNSVEGVQAAVADLYILSSSHGILSPYWSSFAAMADSLAASRVPMENSKDENLLQLLTGDSMVDNPMNPWNRALP